MESQYENNMFSEGSSWIWLQGRHAANTYAQFKHICRTNASGTARLAVSVDGQYSIHLNGVWIPSSQYGDYPFYKSVQTVQVNLEQGENVLEIAVWYQGEDTSVSRAEMPGLRFEISREGRFLCGSCKVTMVRRMPGYETEGVENITCQLGKGFWFSGRNGGPWEKAAEVRKEAVCVPRPISELKTEDPCGVRILSQGVFEAGEEEEPGLRMQHAGLFFREFDGITKGAAFPCLPSPQGIRLMSEEKDGLYLLLDLERIREGCLKLDLTCPQKTEVEVGFGEHLEDLRVRSAVGGRCFAVRYTAGPAREPFVYRFRRLGCRYLQIFIYGSEAVLYYAGLLPVSYPVDLSPDFRCADHLHNQIYRVGRDTLRNCMHEHYEDCPWREQALYAFDARNQMLAGYYAFGEFTYARENLRLQALSQREDGLLELCSPARVDITIPVFSLAFIWAMEEYYRYSGDAAFAKEMAPVIGRILHRMSRQMSGGLAMAFSEPGYWNFYEWQPMLDGQPLRRDGLSAPSADAVLQLCYLLALQRAAALYDSKRYQQEITSVTAGLESYWNEQQGAYAAFIREGEQMCYSQLVQALALYTGACPKGRRDSLYRTLTEDGLIPVTLSSSIFKYEALLMEPERFGRLVFDEVADRWGRMLFCGATAFWETDEGAGAFDRAGSLCHGWSSIPVYLYGAYVLGVRPAAPGEWKCFKRDNFGIYEAEGIIKTPSGCLRV